MISDHIIIKPFRISHRPNLQTLHSDSQGLSAAITKASMLAESISGKVRVLDTAKVHDYNYYLLLFLNMEIGMISILRFRI